MQSWIIGMFIILYVVMIIFTMLHCVGVSIGGSITAAVILVLGIVLMLKKHDKAGQLPTTVSTQHMIIIIIMTHAVHISLFIAGQLC